jgi:hypothetical protein
MTDTIIAIAVLSIGSIIFLLGIIGGSCDLKELNIEVNIKKDLGKGRSLLAIIVGGILMISGIGIYYEPPSPPPIPTPLQPTPTPDYLIGTWSAKTSDRTGTLVFLSADNFEGTYTYPKTSNTTYFKGSYQIKDSKLTFKYSDGTYNSVSLTYMDMNSFGINDIVYKRIATAEIPPDYLIGTWSANKTSDWTATLVFHSDGNFELTNTYSNTNNASYFKGSYQITDSKLIFTYSDGTFNSVSLTYMDLNSFGINGVVHKRVNV